MWVCEEFTLRGSPSLQPPQNGGKKNLCHTQASRHAHIKYAWGPLHYTSFRIPAGKTKHDKQAGCLRTRQPVARGSDTLALSTSLRKKRFVVARKTWKGQWPCLTPRRAARRPADEAAKATHRCRCCRPPG